MMMAPTLCVVFVTNTPFFDSGVYTFLGSLSSHWPCMVMVAVLLHLAFAHEKAIHTIGNSQTSEARSGHC